MNTNVPDTIVAELKQNADKRIAKSLDNIANACKILLKSNEMLTYKMIGEFCSKEFGKPSVGTINNDASKIYKRVIDEYKRVVEKKDIREKARVNEYDGLPLETIIYINNLEERLVTLENILKDEDKKYRNGVVISLEATLAETPNSRGHVKPQSSILLTEVQRKVIEVLAGGSDEIIITGKENRRRVTETVSGEVVIAPSELTSILALLS